jgi:hypothetical protein
LNGEPYNLSGNSLVAASGSYVLFSKNYERAPRFNDFYVSGAIPSFSAFQPYSSSTNVFLPPGNYTLNLNLNYSPSRIVKSGVNSGNYSLVPLPENYAVIQPFTVESPTNLALINVPGQMYPGYYIIQSMITKNMSTGSVIGQDSVGRNEYNTPSLMFSYNNTFLYPNTTYYFWLWSSGVPGGLYIPITNNMTSGHSNIALIYNGTGYDSYGYYFTSYSNLSENGYGLTFTLVGSSENSSISKTYPTSLTIVFGGSVFNVSLSGSVNASYNAHISTSQPSGLKFSSPFLNGAILGGSFTIFSHTYVTLHHGGSFSSLYLWFALVILIFAIVVLLSYLWIPIKRYREIYKISIYTLSLSTLAFFIVFGIFYYAYYFVVILLKVLSVLMILSLFLVLVYSDAFISDENDLDSILSITKSEQI